MWAGNYALSSSYTGLTNDHAVITYRMLHTQTSWYGRDRRRRGIVHSFILLGSNGPTRRLQQSAKDRSDVSTHHPAERSTEASTPVRRRLQRTTERNAGKTLTAERSCTRARESRARQWFGFSSRDLGGGSRHWKGCGARRMDHKKRSTDFASSVNSSMMAPLPGLNMEAQRLP